MNLLSDVGDGSTDVRRDQIEQLLGGGGEAADSKLGVEEYRGDVGAGQQVVEIVVGRLQLRDLAFQLAVRGGELFVERLQLFLRGFHLLGARLELLVHRHELFVRRSEILDGLLQVLLGGLELVLELVHHRVVGAARDDGAGIGCGGGLVFERHQPEVLGLLAGIERLDGRLHGLEHRAAAHLQARNHDPPVFADRYPDGAAQFASQPGPHLHQEIPRRRTTRLHEIVFGSTVEVQDLPAAVDDHRRGRITLEQEMLRQRRQPPRLRRARCPTARDGPEGCGAGRKLQRGVPCRADAAVDPPLRGNHLEKIGLRPDPLGAPQEEIATVDEGEVQQREESLLGGRLEIDEEIPTTDQIEPGERRIAEQALWRKHDGVTQLLGHLIAMAVLDEEAGQPFGRYLGGDALRIRTGPRRLEPIGVDVRREHLQDASLLRRADLLDQHHRERVGFLSGGAGGYPDPERGVHGLGGDQLPNRLLA